jgi:MFS family permease
MTVRAQDDQTAGVAVKADTLIRRGQMSRRNAWIVVGALFVAAIAIPVNQYKVPPVMPVLMEAFRLDLTTANLLMSVFSLSGLLLAIPAGFIVQRVGPKRMGLVSLGSVVVGALLGALASGTAALLVSRTIEGLSFVLMMVVAPAIIAVWFSSEERGAPMGIFATWVPVGSMIALNVAPALVSGFGWQAIWWFGAAYGAVAFLVFWALVRMPSPVAATGGVSNARATAAHSRSPSMATMGRALANRNVWLLGILFFCFTLCLPGFMTNMPTFLHTVRGYPLRTAAFIVSLSSVATIISCPVAGWISDRIGSRKLVYTIAFLVIAALWLLPFRVTGVGIPLFMIVFGVFAGVIPTMIFAAVPEVMDRPELAGIGMGGVVTLQNLGLLLGPVMFARIVQISGRWEVAGYALIPICLIGVVVGLLVEVR